MRKSDVKKAIRNVRERGLFPHGEINCKVVQKRVLDELEKELKL